MPKLKKFKCDILSDFSNNVLIVSWEIVADILRDFHVIQRNGESWFDGNQKNTKQGSWPVISNIP